MKRFVNAELEMPYTMKTLLLRFAAQNNGIISKQAIEKGMAIPDLEEDLLILQQIGTRVNQNIAQVSTETNGVR